MKPMHLIQRIMMNLQAISSLYRNTLHKSENEQTCNIKLIHINGKPLGITPLLTFRNILSAFVQCWTSMMLSLPISHNKRRIVKVYKIKNFSFFVKPLPTQIATALKALKKTVQLYEIMYNFCTVFISENSIKLEGNHREYIVRLNTEFMNTSSAVNQTAQ